MTALCRTRPAGGYRFTAADGPARPLDVRLDGTRTQARLTARLRGAREFLAPAPA
jgi:hypothetical protein